MNTQAKQGAMLPAGDVVEALDYIVRRLQADIDDGGRPDQWSMEDMVRKARAGLDALSSAPAGDAVALAAALQALLDACHEGQLIPLNQASAGYVASVIEAGEAALAAHRSAPRVALNEDGSVRRFYINPENGYVVETQRGSWVRYVDHVAALSRAPAGDVVALFDDAVAAELPRVSHVEYDSHEICKHFAGEVRKRLDAALQSWQADSRSAP